MPQRHIPERTCVACRSLRPKREMVRVVRTTDGPVQIDLTGKQAGRGAYLCRRRECWHRALRQEALGRALKTELSAADRDTLRSFGDEQAAADQQVSATEHTSEHPLQRRPAHG